MRRRCPPVAWVAWTSSPDPRPQRKRPERIALAVSFSAKLTWQMECSTERKETHAFAGSRKSTKGKVRRSGQRQAVVFRLHHLVRAAAMAGEPGNESHVRIGRADKCPHQAAQG